MIPLLQALKHSSGDIMYFIICNESNKKTKTIRELILQTSHVCIQSFLYLILLFCTAQNETLYLQGVFQRFTPQQEPQTGSQKVQLDGLKHCWFWYFHETY